MSLYIYISVILSQQLENFMVKAAAGFQLKILFNLFQHFINQIFANHINIV